MLLPDDVLSQHIIAEIKDGNNVTIRWGFSSPWVWDLSRIRHYQVAGLCSAMILEISRQEETGYLYRIRGLDFESEPVFCHTLKDAERACALAIGGHLIAALRDWASRIDTDDAVLYEQLRSFRRDAEALMVELDKRCGGVIR